MYVYSRTHNDCRRVSDVERKDLVQSCFIVPFLGVALNRPQQLLYLCLSVQIVLLGISHYCFEHIFAHRFAYALIAML